MKVVGVLLVLTSVAAADERPLYLGFEAGAGLGADVDAEVPGLFVHGAVSADWRVDPALSIGAQLSAYTVNISWQDVLARATLTAPCDCSVRPYLRVAGGISFVPESAPPTGSPSTLVGTVFELGGGLRITPAAGRDIEIGLTYGHWTAGSSSIADTMRQDIKAFSLSAGFAFEL